MATSTSTPRHHVILLELRVIGMPLFEQMRQSRLPRPNNKTGANHRRLHKNQSILLLRVGKVLVLAE